MQITTEKRKRKIFPETALLRARQISRKVARCITYKGVLFEKQSNKRIHYKSHKTIHIPAHWPGLFPTEIRWLFATGNWWSMCALKSLIYWMPAPYTVKSSDLIHDPVHIYIYTLGWSSIISRSLFSNAHPRYTNNGISIHIPAHWPGLFPTEIRWLFANNWWSMCALKSFICLIIAPYTVKSSDLIHDPVPIYIYIYFGMKFISRSVQFSNAHTRYTTNFHHNSFRCQIPRRKITSTIFLHAALYSCPILFPNNSQ